MGQQNICVDNVGVVGYFGREGVPWGANDQLTCSQVRMHGLEFAIVPNLLGI